MVPTSTQASLPRTALSVSGPMTQEVTVVTNGVPAKYGNTGGGVVIQATRGGTNQIHGQLNWRHNDPAFNAQPLGNTIPNAQHQNWFGMYGGGPVYIPKVYNGRNKTFFYAGFEPARLFNDTTALATMPTPDELAGNFANAYSLINTNILSTQGLAAALAAPRTGGLYYQSALNSSGFPTGPQYTSTSQYVAIPNLNLSNQLNANKFAKFVLGLMPTPQNPGPFVQFLLPSGLWNNLGQNIVYERGVTNTDNRYSFRIDHVISPNDRLFVRYSAAPVTSVRFQGFPVNSILTTIPSDQSWANNVSLDETHIITPAMVNEVKIMYARNKQARGEAPASLGEDWAAAYGLTPAVTGAGFPHLSWSSFSLGPGTTSISGQTDVNFQVSDDVTWTRGGTQLPLERISGISNPTNATLPDCTAEVILQHQPDQQRQRRQRSGQLRSGPDQQFLEYACAGSSLLPMALLWRLPARRPPAPSRIDDQCRVAL